MENSRIEDSSFCVLISSWFVHKENAYNLENDSIKDFLNHSRHVLVFFYGHVFLPYQTVILNCMNKNAAKEQNDVTMTFLIWQRNCYVFCFWRFLLPTVMIFMKVIVLTLQSKITYYTKNK